MAETFPGAGVRIHAVVEGPTEERFVNTILAPHFAQRAMNLVPHLVRTSRDGSTTGGMVSYAKVRFDLNGHLHADPGAYVTTMFDLYGLHPTFPGFEASTQIRDCHSRAQHLDSALQADLGEIGRLRFIPHIQLHEFEALLFSDLEVLDHEMQRSEQPSHREELNRILEECGEPELINDGRETAPSKRLKLLYPGYSKVLMGTRVAERIGLDDIRACCPHFDDWICRLEGLRPLV